eukprot:15004695-Ditylum_brightwellii.AAC.1
MIIVYTDNRNLTYKTINSERVIRWRMVIEDFLPEPVYIKGNSNLVANVIIRHLNNKVADLLTIAEYYGNKQLSDEMYPVQSKLIQTEEQEEKKLLEKTDTSTSWGQQEMPFHLFE